MEFNWNVAIAAASPILMATITYIFTIIRSNKRITQSRSNELFTMRVKAHTHINRNISRKIDKLELDYVDNAFRDSFLTPAQIGGRPIPSALKDYMVDCLGIVIDMMSQHGLAMAPPVKNACEDLSNALIRAISYSNTQSSKELSKLSALDDLKLIYSPSYEAFKEVLRKHTGMYALDKSMRKLSKAKGGDEKGIVSKRDPVKKRGDRQKNKKRRKNGHGLKE